MAQEQPLGTMCLPGIDDKIAVVTGGSSGIGRATAIALARAGAKIALTTHGDDDASENMLREIRMLGSEAIARRIDVGREADVEMLFYDCERELGPPSLLVNSAGINQAGIA